METLLNDELKMIYSVSREIFWTIWLRERTLTA